RNSAIIHLRDRGLLPNYLPPSTAFTFLGDINSTPAITYRPPTLIIISVTARS
ncbi:4908_t:CDS:1, partial [Paraglomus brasilianum]